MAINLDPNIFTLDERVALQNLIDLGRWQDIAAFSIGTSLNPSKEKELEKIVEWLRPNAEGFVSKYKNDAVHPIGQDLPPEKVEEIQQKMVAEFQDWKSKRLKEREEKLKKLQIEETPPAVSVTSDSPKPRRGRPKKINT